jgi:hypothetical protein
MAKECFHAWNATRAHLVSQAAGERKCRRIRTTRQRQADLASRFAQQRKKIPQTLPLRPSAQFADTPPPYDGLEVRRTHTATVRRTSSPSNPHHHRTTDFQSVEPTPPPYDGLEVRRTVVMVIGLKVDERSSYEFTAGFPAAHERCSAHLNTRPNRLAWRCWTPMTTLKRVLKSHELVKHNWKIAGAMMGQNSLLSFCAGSTTSPFQIGRRGGMKEGARKCRAS